MTRHPELIFGLCGLLLVTVILLLTKQSRPTLPDGCSSAMLTTSVRKIVVEGSDPIFVPPGHTVVVTACTGGGGLKP